ncbi:hypothetical protein PIROE2DRAFT_58147 [Piromyces sp. E2]|nr:hypothetical protein PIROE2DRAFT_58147 [Piromyces sp. E2]|eukprot:OUM68392.1 hypothetical protein PIROE2DRAFT_58147 [Piromyces sp. E2]
MFDWNNSKYIYKKPNYIPFQLELEWCFDFSQANVFIDSLELSVMQNDHDYHIFNDYFGSVNSITWYVHTGLTYDLINDTHLSIFNRKEEEEEEEEEKDIPKKYKLYKIKNIKNLINFPPSISSSSSSLPDNTPITCMKEKLKNELTFRESHQQQQINFRGIPVVEYNESENNSMVWQKIPENEEITQKISSAHPNTVYDTAPPPIYKFNKVDLSNSARDQQGFILKAVIQEKQTKEIVLEDVDYIAFYQILFFCYNYQFPEEDYYNMYDWLSILHVSSRFLFTDIFKYTEYKLCQFLTRDNLLELYKYSDKYYAIHLKKYCECKMNYYQINIQKKKDKDEVIIDIKSENSKSTEDEKNSSALITFYSLSVFLNIIYNLGYIGAVMMFVFSTYKARESNYRYLPLSSTGIVLIGLLLAIGNGLYIIFEILSLGVLVLGQVILWPLIETTRYYRNNNKIIKGYWNGVKLERQLYRNADFKLPHETITDDDMKCSDSNITDSISKTSKLSSNDISLNENSPSPKMDNTNKNKDDIKDTKDIKDIKNSEDTKNTKDNDKTMVLTLVDDKKIEKNYTSYSYSLQEIIFDKEKENQLIIPRKYFKYQSYGGLTLQILFYRFKKVIISCLSWNKIALLPLGLIFMLIPSYRLPYIKNQYDGIQFFWIHKKDNIKQPNFY